MSDESTLVEGPPRLAVEVLSPSDKLEEIREKVLEYLDVGVDIVWIVDPYFQTAQVHARGVAPVSYTCEQRMNGGDVLPGLEFAVADIFNRAWFRRHGKASGRQEFTTPHPALSSANPQRRQRRAYK